MIREGGTWAKIYKTQSEIQEFLVVTLVVFIQGEEKILGYQSLASHI